MTRIERAAGKSALASTAEKSVNLKAEKPRATDDPLSEGIARPSASATIPSIEIANKVDISKKGRA
jgi:hypothetical protein